jgi:hypothetical protein
MFQIQVYIYVNDMIFFVWIIVTYVRKLNWVQMVIMSLSIRRMFHSYSTACEIAGVVWWYLPSWLEMKVGYTYSHA